MGVQKRYDADALIIHLCQAVRALNDPNIATRFQTVITTPHHINHSNAVENGSNTKPSIYGPPVQPLMYFRKHTQGLAAVADVSKKITEPLCPN